MFCYVCYFASFPLLIIKYHSLRCFFAWGSIYICSHISENVVTLVTPKKVARRCGFSGSKKVTTFKPPIVVTFLRSASNQPL